VHELVTRKQQPNIRLLEMPDFAAYLPDQKVIVNS